MKHERLTGYAFALFTIIVWGSTFISSKILLTTYTPAQIMLTRFLLAYAALWLLRPRRMALSWRQELSFIVLGLTGCSVYFYTENSALTYTLASNVGVIISVAPFFTAMLTHLFMRGEERLRPNFFAGFAAAMAGICLISFNGAEGFTLSPVGDLLALAAALIWACYSVLTRKISGFGYGTIQATRRIFFYGLLFMAPTLFLFDFNPDLTRFSNPVYLFNILFLGFGASALCFVTWNTAVRVLGAVKTSIYIYMVPVITVVTSVIVLGETVTPASALGILLTLTGLLLSESKFEWKKRSTQNGLAE